MIIYKQFSNMPIVFILSRLKVILPLINRNLTFNDNICIVVSMLFDAFYLPIHKVEIGVTHFL